MYPLVVQTRSKDSHRGMQVEYRLGRLVGVLLALAMSSKSRWVDLQPRVLPQFEFRIERKDESPGGATTHPLYVCSALKFDVLKFVVRVGHRDCARTLDDGLGQGVLDLRASCSSHGGDPVY